MPPLMHATCSIVCLRGDHARAECPTMPMRVPPPLPALSLLFGCTRAPSSAPLTPSALSLALGAAHARRAWPPLTPSSEARCRQRCCPRPPHAQPALVQYNATDASPCHCHSRPPPRHAAHARGWTFPGQCRPSQSPVRVRVGQGLPQPCSSPPAPSLSAETASSRTSSAVNPRQGLHARIREKGRVFL